MQEKTQAIIREDIDRVRAYARLFGVTMPEVGPDGSVKGLPAPYPREVAGMIRDGHRLTALARQAAHTGIPVQNPILGRNSGAETLAQSRDMYAIADQLGIKLFHFVHSEATRHIDPLDGAELIEQSRGKGGITPKGEREFVQIGGGAVHPLRINATGDTPHLSILNAFIAGFDGTDIGPVIHVHFGGRGIHDYKTKVKNGFKALEICAENNIYVQIESHKHLNNIGGTDGAGLAGCLLAEGLAVLAGLPAELGALQMNVAGINLLADLAAIRAFRRVMGSEALIVVPETFQNPPPDLIAEQGHFARMAMAARLGGANFYRPKAAESVGIPTGESMGHAIWATQNIFENMASITINDPAIDRREEIILTEAMAVLAATLGLKSLPAPEDITAAFWRRYEPEELIEKIVTAGKQGILDAPRAGGWDLKRAVKTHRDRDGIRRYVPGYGPAMIDPRYLDFSQEEVSVPALPPVSEKARVVLATVGADAHVVGVNQIREAFQQAGFEVIYMRGMNLPETVAEVVAESKAQVVGVSNLLGLGITLFPRLDKRLKELGLRDKVLVIAGGRIAEKEEEHAELEAKIKTEGPEFIGVDAFFGPGTDPQEPVAWVRAHLKEVMGDE